MIDSIEDISAALTEAEPQRLTALYDALRLQMTYNPNSRIVDVTVQPRGRVNSACVRCRHYELGIDVGLRHRSGSLHRTRACHLITTPP
jgi:hypothetical protein